MNVIRRIPDSVFVFFAFFLFFILNLTSNFSGPHDSMGYLNDLDKARDLFPAPHLLYHYTSYSLLHLLTHLFPSTEHYYLLEAIDAAWGCLGLTVVYRIFLNRMNMTRVESFLATAVVAFSFGMWFYCSNIEVYMPPLYFILLCLYVCTKERLESGDILKLALLHALAVLFHQVNILFTPIILYKIWASRKTLPLFPSIFKYGIVSASLVIVIFIFAGWILDGHNNIKDFYVWLRGYTLESNYWFAFGFNTLIKALVGFGHALFGGHYIFRIRFLESFMQRIFYYHSLDDEAFLVRNLNYSVAFLLLILTIVVCIIFSIMLLRIVLNWKKLFGRYSYLMVPLGMFLVIYSCFFYFWMPENLEFWIPQCTIFWIFTIGIYSKLNKPVWIKKNAYIYGSLALLLFVINYEGTIRWMKDINNDSVYVKIKKTAALTTEKDIILLQDPWLLEDFLEHYSVAKTYRIPSLPLKARELDITVQNKLDSGGKIYLFTEGGSMHASKNKQYMDSLMQAPQVETRDLNNELTPVKVVSKKAGY